MTCKTITTDITMVGEGIEGGAGTAEVAVAWRDEAVFSFDGDTFVD